MNTRETSDREDTRPDTGALSQIAQWGPHTPVLAALIPALDVLEAGFLKLSWIPRPGEPVRTAFTIATFSLMVLAAFAIAAQFRRQIRALRSQSSRNATMVQLLPMGVFRTDSDGRFVHVNSRWSAMTGLDAPPASGDGWTAALHAEDRDRVNKGWQEAAKKGIEFRDEYRFQTPRGQVTWVSCSAIELRDERGQKTGYLGAVTDISALKETQRELREAVEEKRRAVEREQLLRRELDHRMRNNLTSILGVVRMRQQDQNPKHDALMAVRSAIQAFERANDLIAISQGPVEVTTLIWQLVRTLIPVDAQSRIMLSGDRTGLSHESASSMSMVIQELLTNSMKHGALGQPGGRVTVEAIDAEGDSRQLRLTWEERGGRPASDIVEGMGFMIMRTLVENDLGGTMKIDAGAEFRVEIRISIQPQGSSARASAGTPSGASGRSFGAST